MVRLRDQGVRIECESASGSRTSWVESMDSGMDDEREDFEASDRFKGRRVGWVFKRGSVDGVMRTGYFRDVERCPPSPVRRRSRLKKVRWLMRLRGSSEPERPSTPERRSSSTQSDEILSDVRWRYLADITIVRGSNLLGKIPIIKTSNPYVVVCHNGVEVGRTRTVLQTCDPVWEYTVQDVIVAEGSTVQLCVECAWPSQIVMQKFEPDKPRAPRSSMGTVTLRVMCEEEPDHGLAKLNHAKTGVPHVFNVKGGGGTLEVRLELRHRNMLPSAMWPASSPLPPRETLQRRGMTPSVAVRAIDLAVCQGMSHIASQMRPIVRVMEQTGTDFESEELAKAFSVLSEIGVKYVDPSFPPFPGKWRRLREIYPTYIVFGQRQIKPYHARQGDLEDCWLMCAVAGLAHQQTRLIRKLFLFPKTSFPIQAERQSADASLFRLRLYHGGQPRVVTVDDFVPCHEYTGEPLYASCDTKEATAVVWPMLLEKAWAKLCGAYGRLESGFAHDALIDLTGAPAIRYKLKEDKIHRLIVAREMFSFMHDAYGNTLIMSAGTHGDGPLVNELAQVGLFARHAYSILAVVSWPPTRPHGEPADGLVLLRDPTGRKISCSGSSRQGHQRDWSADDPRWKDPEVIRHFKEEWARGFEDDVPFEAPPKEGTVWLPFDTFATYFESLSLCLPRVPPGRRGTMPRKQDDAMLVVENWLERRLRTSFEFGGHYNSNRQRGTNSDSGYAQLYKLTLERESLAFVMAHQPDRRVEGRGDQYADLALTILREETPSARPRPLTLSGAPIAEQQQQQAVQNNFTLFASVSPSVQRQIICPPIVPGDLSERLWPAGNYIVVVWSAACLGLREPVDKKGAWPTNDDAPRRLRNAVSEIFDRFDREHTGALDVDAIAELTTQCPEILLDGGPAANMGRDSFRAANTRFTESEFRRWLLGRSDAHRLLLRFGYEPGQSPQHAPILTTRLPVVVSVHAEPESNARLVEVSPHEYPDGLVEWAQTESIIENGDATPLSVGVGETKLVDIYKSPSPGDCGVSIVAVNTTILHVKITFEIDGAPRTNCEARSERQGVNPLAVSRTLAPFQAKVVLHVAPRDTTRQWKCDYKQMPSCSVVPVPLGDFPGVIPDQPWRSVILSENHGAFFWRLYASKPDAEKEWASLSNFVAAVLFFERPNSPGEFKARKEYGPPQAIRKIKDHMTRSLTDYFAGVTSTRGGGGMQPPRRSSW